MSHAVVRGAPTAAQRYVDSVLTAAGTTTSLPAVLLHCLSSWPDDLMMINGANGEHVTNGTMLGRALRIARMLGGRRDSRGTLMLGANSPALVAAQLGSLFAGRIALGLDAFYTTRFELEYFLKLWPPAVIFCDPERQADVLQAAQAALHHTPDVILLADGDAWLDHCSQGCSRSLEGFTLPKVSAADTAVLLPTTGSTGPAKAAMIQHEALIAHLLDIWRSERLFPRPQRRAMVFSSSQWMTWWSVTTSAIVGRVTLVMTSAPFSPAHSWEVFNKFEVSWALMSPVLGARLLEHEARATSLQMLLLTGSAVHPSTMQQLQDRLPEGGIVRQGYGMTECQGFFSVPDKDTPFTSVGKPLNIFNYKILGDDGEEMGLNQKGELCIQSDCVIKLITTYIANDVADDVKERPILLSALSDTTFNLAADLALPKEVQEVPFEDIVLLLDGHFTPKRGGFGDRYVNNEEALRESLTADGWLRSGDRFTADEAGNLYFVERSKFCFKVDSWQVSPEEVETVIGELPGVSVSAVCGVAEGAAALVVRSDPTLTRATIHQAVDSRLAPYKRLRAGIAFVPTLPLTHNGKLHRRNCIALAHKLIQDKQLYVG